MSLDTIESHLVEDSIITGVAIIITTGRTRDNIIYVVENTSKAWKLKGQKSIPFETVENGENLKQAASRGVKEELGIDIGINKFDEIGTFTLIVKEALKQIKIRVEVVCVHLEDVVVENIACSEISEKGIMKISDMLRLENHVKRPCVDESLLLLYGREPSDVVISNLMSS